MHKHMLYQLVSIAVFKKLCHQAIKWYIYPGIVINSIASSTLSTRFLYFTHSIIITFTACVSFTWSSNNTLICSKFDSIKITINVYFCYPRYHKVSISSFQCPFVLCCCETDVAFCLLFFPSFFSMSFNLSHPYSILSIILPF